MPTEVGDIQLPGQKSLAPYFFWLPPKFVWESVHRYNKPDHPLDHKITITHKSGKNICKSSD